MHQRRIYELGFMILAWLLVPGMAFSQGQEKVKIVYEAEKHGFRILAKASEVVQFPFIGPTANLEKIKNQREQVKRLIRAEIEALRFIHQRREESEVQRDLSIGR